MMRSDLRVVLLAASAWALPAGVGLLAHPLPAAAQATNFRQEMDDIKNAIPGLGNDRAPIDFTERAPLVVPPTNDLPPPVEAPPRLGVTDPDTANRTEALSDPRRPVPLTDPGAAASGPNARPFLIDPPSGMRNPDAIAGDAAADGFKDAPKRKKGSQTAKVHHPRRTPAVAAAQ